MNLIVRAQGSKVANVMQKIMIVIVGVVMFMAGLLIGGWSFQGSVFSERLGSVVVLDELGHVYVPARPAVAPRPLVWKLLCPSK